MSSTTLSAPPAASSSAANPASFDAMGGLRRFTLPALLGVIWMLFALMEPQFLSPRNLTMLMIELAATATLAVGVLLVLLPGHTDLSVGAGAGLCGGIASVLVFHHAWPAPAALALSFVAGVLLWWLMGLFIVKNRLQAFIITLGGMLAFRGAFWLIIGSATVPVTRGGESTLYAAFTTYYLPTWASVVLAGGVFALVAGSRWRRRERRRALGLAVETGEILFLKLFILAQLMALVVLVADSYRGVPLALVLLAAVAGFVQVLTAHTPFGRHLYAIGGNEEAAVISGIPVPRVTILAFTLLGGITALAGFMTTAYAGASTTTTGYLMELDAIAACVIGGTSLKGGRGTVMGALLGALIMASLLNGMGLMAVRPELKDIARGLVLALAVWMDARLGRK